MATILVNYLVVAGGGASLDAGGGGAGGVLTGTSSIDTINTYAITVGEGGVGGGANNGQDSSFNNITATGGGSGANASSVGNGGSGGGGYYGLRSDGLVFGPTNPGTGIAGQGFAGGAFAAPSLPPSSSYAVGAGGGGAGAAGISNGGSNNWTGGNGGVGISSSITGTATFYGGGGGGNGFYDGLGGAGGNGGGGRGRDAANAPAPAPGTAGTPHTGGGGGGGGFSGGSGVVIISYAGAPQFVGGVISSVSGNTIHLFRNSGSLAPAQFPVNYLSQLQVAVAVVMAPLQSAMLVVAAQAVSCKAQLISTPHRLPSVGASPLPSVRAVLVAQLQPLMVLMAVTPPFSRHRNRWRRRFICWQWREWRFWRWRRRCSWCY